MRQHFINGCSAGKTLSTTTTILLLFLLAVCGTLPFGCGEKGFDRYSYRLLKGDELIGSEVVERHRRSNNKDEITIESTIRRPFQPFDTTITYELEVSMPGYTLVSYKARYKRPGSCQEIKIWPEGEDINFLTDREQTFSGIAMTDWPEDLVILELRSVGLVQNLVDRFRSGGRKEQFSVVVPSRGAIGREARVQAEGGNDDSLRIEISRVGTAKVKLSGAGVIEELTADNDWLTDGEIKAQKTGGVGRLTSKTYSPPGRRYSVDEVSFESEDKTPLVGKFFIPDRRGPFPTVVLQSGYGPYDWTANGLFSHLASQLASEGYAVLSFDKRGVPESGGEYRTYTLDTLVEDLAAAVDYLIYRKDVDVENIGVVGWGEGSLAVIRVAQMNPYVKVVVLLAGCGQPYFPDVVRQGTEARVANGSLGPGEGEQILIGITRGVETVESVPGDQESLETKGHDFFLGWMRKHMSFQPPEVISTLENPMLVLHGGQDGIVPPEQAKMIEMALVNGVCSDYTVRIFPDLGHDFGPVVPEEDTAPFRSHTVPDKDFIEVLVDWLGSRLK